MKLDIGSGLNDDESWVKLDNMSDVDVTKDPGFWQNEEGKWNVNVLGDGNALPFKDESFDEVQSTRCIGYYADVYEAIRVLKTGGLLKLNVWTEKLGDVMNQLVESKMMIVETIEGLNYDSDEVGFYDVWIEAKKVGDGLGMQILDNE